MKIIYIWFWNIWMIYSSGNRRCTRQKFLTFWAIFCPLTTWKIKILTLKKNTWRYYHFTHLHHKWQLYDVWFLIYGTLWNFLSFWTAFGPRKSEFLKKWKTTWTYYHFTNIYHKWQSHDVWFLRYGVQQTYFFVILGHFLAFYPPNNLKN